MTGSQRREQLITIGRELFAEKGFDGASVEEIAARAQVSKPVVYEHFGGKEGIYAVIVDREVTNLTRALTTALAEGGHPRAILERTALALLDYIEEEPDGFRIISRDSSPYAPGGTFQTILSSVASRVEGLLALQFERRGFDPGTAPLYSQMLVGLVALAGQWWVESHNQTTLTKPQVAAHLVNLAWNGMRNLQPQPVLRVSEAPPADAAQA